MKVSRLDVEIVRAGVLYWEETFIGDENCVKEGSPFLSFREPSLAFAGHGVGK
jgi:hypothetical protein